ncbi:MAG: hypothetical protein ACRD3B_18340 [Candidatus Sulfotelmatobacter sp.]
MALMRSFAPAAGMRGRSQTLHRDRSETSGKREQQKQSGGQALHFFLEDRNKASSRID